MRGRFKPPILLFFIILPIFGGDGDATLKAFERHPGYVQPFATIIGSLTNAGWFQSASIGKDFSFGVSLPISVIYLNNSDREYAATYTDPECQKCREKEATGVSVDCKECIECQKSTAPTIFGWIKQPNVLQYTRGVDSSITNVQTIKSEYSSGHEDFNQIAGLPFATLQASFSWYYSAVTLRYVGIPEISGFSIHLPGIGLQHDFRHFFPTLPVSLSLAANFTILTAAWTPGGDIKGKLKLNGLSNFLGILAGYQPKKFLEIFLETGWEHSFLQPSGTVIVNGESLTPNKRLTGRNGFRASLNIAFPITYHPVIGGIGGAQFGYFANLISFKSKKRE